LIAELEARLVQERAPIFDIIQIPLDSDSKLRQLIGLVLIPSDHLVHELAILTGITTNGSGQSVSDFLSRPIHVHLSLFEELFEASFNSCFQLCPALLSNLLVRGAKQPPKQAAEDAAYQRPNTG
jgi:hypothetical protein